MIGNHEEVISGVWAWTAIVDVPIAKTILVASTLMIIIGFAVIRSRVRRVTKRRLRAAIDAYAELSLSRS